MFFRPANINFLNGINGARSGLSRLGIAIDEQKYIEGTLVSQILLTLQFAI